MRLNRRTLIYGSASTALLATTPGSLPAAPALDAPIAPAATPPQVTRILAQFVVQSRADDLPAAVLQEGTRTLLNWTGCAIGGSRQPAVDKAIAASAPFSGPPQANVLGRVERLDVMQAALMNGISSHIFDYDDTHLKTVIHPAGPVVPAILALAQHRAVSGRDFLHALILGVECECRIGNAVYPSHYEMGWHITGTCGAFGSAVACGKLLGLDATQMANALGIAASQPVGLKIQFGSMTKSFHVGRAAQNGMLAAMLAAQQFTADDASLEGKDGWGQALSREQHWREVTADLGTRYEAALNTYKPFACGIVTHPGIDAAIQLRNEFRLRPEQIQEVLLRANPLVLSLTGKEHPQTGLEGKFSIYHCIAIALIDGAAGERQFSDHAVLDPPSVSLRQRVHVQLDAGLTTEQGDLSIRLTDGRTLHKHIEHAIGSLERPMTSQALETKFTALAEGILPPDRIRQVIDLCWQVTGLEAAGDIARMSSSA